MRDIGRFFGDLFLSDKEKAKKAAKEKKQQEIREMERRGEDMQTWQQRQATEYRNEYLKLKEEMGFEGEILNVEKGQNDYYNGVVKFQAEEGGHKIIGSFEVATCKDGCCIKGAGFEKNGLRGEANDWSANLIIDGKELSLGVAREYMKAKFDLINVRWLQKNVEAVAPGSVVKEAEAHRKSVAQEIEEKRKREKEIILDAEQKREQEAGRAELVAVLSKPPEQPQA